MVLENQESYVRFRKLWVAFGLALMFFGFFQAMKHTLSDDDYAVLSLGLFVSNDSRLPDELDLTKLQRALWIKQENSSTSIGYHREGLWFKMQVPEIPGKDHLLVIKAPFLNYLDLYVWEDEIFKKKEFGDLRRWDGRDVMHPDVIVPLNPSHSGATFYAYVRNNGPIYFPAQIWQSTRFIEAERIDNIWRGFIIGWLAYTMLLNLLLFRSFKQYRYLWYLAGLFCGTLTFLILQGGSTQFLWPYFPHANALFSVFSTLAVACYARFTEEFLTIHGFHRLLTRLLFYVCIAASFVILFDPFLARMASVLNLILGVTLLLYVSSAEFIARKPYAGYYFLSIAPPAIGGLIIAFRGFGIIPGNVVPVSGLFWGLAINSLVLTFAVSRRLADETEYRLETQSELLEKSARLLETETNLANVSRYHPVSHLPNRNMLALRMQELSTLEDDPNAIMEDHIQLWCLEIGRFRFIECTLGGSRKEQFMAAVSESLEDKLKAHLGDDLLAIELQDQPVTNPPVLASLDTPNFAFLVKGGRDINHSLVTWLIDRLSQPFFFQQNFWDLDPKLGTASFTKKAIAELDDCESIIAYVTLAVAQTNTYHRWEHFDIHNDCNAFAGPEVAWDVQKAIANREIQPYFQPKRDLQTGKVVGFEALLRRYTEKQGFISPVALIRYAEKTGTINQLTLAICEQAIGFLKQLHDFGHYDLQISINVSVFDLTSPRFADDLFNVFLQHKVAASSFILELTEASAFEGLETVLKNLQALKKGGVYLALDDFGTGYASVSLLNDLPIDEVKIDKSLLFGLLESEKRQNTLKALVDMSRKLGLQPVIEGVENEELLSWLRKLPPVIVQGYGIAKPMAQADAIEWLKHLH